MNNCCKGAVTRLYHREGSITGKCFDGPIIGWSYNRPVSRAYNWDFTMYY